DGAGLAARRCAVWAETMKPRPLADKPSANAVRSALGKRTPAGRGRCATYKLMRGTAMRPASRLLLPRQGAFFETARRFGGRGNGHARRKPKRASRLMARPRGGQRAKRVYGREQRILR